MLYTLLHLFYIHCCNFYDQMLQCILPAECRCRHFVCKGEILFGGNQTDTVTAKEKHTHTHTIFRYDVTSTQLQ